MTVLWNFLDTRIFGDLEAMDKNDVFVTKCLVAKVVVLSLAASRASHIWVELVGVLSNWLENEGMGWR